MNLKIIDFGSDAKLNESIRTYSGLLEDYAGKMGYRNFLHTSGHLIEI